jgi:hypothetical protein
MKTKKIQKKLVLNKESIVSLKTDGMKQAKAGGEETIPPSIFPWFCFVTFYVVCEPGDLPE